VINIEKLKIITEFSNSNIWRKEGNMKTYKRILFVLGGLIVMLAGCSDPTGDSGTDTTDTVTP
jgi:hypothetical protein